MLEPPLPPQASTAADLGPITTAAPAFSRALALASSHYIVAIGGGALVFFACYLWALEGPGGYHVHPAESRGAATEGNNH